MDGWLNGQELIYFLFWTHTFPGVMMTSVHS